MKRVLLVPNALCMVTWLCLFLLPLYSFASSGDQVRLRDIQALTLHQGKYTTGRRNSPVRQLQCVGGSAAGRYEPKVVQCYNRGSDGHDVQWECKADMSTDYQFGAISVSCEGYNYPDDEFILKGSCGLEYELDYTEEGRRRQSGGGNQHQSYGFKNEYTQPKKKDTFDLSNLFVMGAIVLTIYLLYTTCISAQGGSGGRSTGGGSGGPGGGYPGGPGGGGPPPPGFRPDYQNPPPSYDDACGSSTYSGAQSGAYRRRQAGAAGGGGGGFWTGLGLGGLAGYMFGNRNNRGYNTGYGYQQRQYGFGGPSDFDRPGPSWGGGGGGGFFGGSNNSGSRSSGSSTTHTSSGFGGTKRR